MKPIWTVAIAAGLLCTLAAAQSDSPSPASTRGRAATPALPGRTAQINDYKIGIEDVLNIRVWGESDLSVSVSVRPDGKITVPLVNDIYVEGLTPLEVRDLITEKLAKFIKEPYVTVIVEKINSFQVYVLGEVQSQGILTLQQPTQLLQVLAHAGGVTNFAKKDISIVRTDNGVEKRIHVNYKKLLEGDPSQENIWVKPGDLILVF